MGRHNQPSLKSPYPKVKLGATATILAPTWGWNQQEEWQIRERPSPRRRHWVAESSNPKANLISGCSRKEKKISCLSQSWNFCQMQQKVLSLGQCGGKGTLKGLFPPVRNSKFFEWEMGWELWKDMSKATKWGIREHACLSGFHPVPVPPQLYGFEILSQFWCRGMWARGFKVHRPKSTFRSAEQGQADTRGFLEFLFWNHIPGRKYKNSPKL